MNIWVRMCEDCVKKLKGRTFVGASRYSFKSFSYCVNSGCYNNGTFVVTLRLPERKVIK
jgi:hypothetical protein